MSLKSTPVKDTVPRSIVATVLGAVAAALPTVARLPMGLMLTMGGWFWLHRADPTGYLAEAVGDMVEQERSVGLYAPFLRSVVLPHAGIFAFLVGWGELLSGLSLLLGAATRVGAAVAVFLLIQYGLMGGFVSLFVYHGLFIALVASAVYWNSGRRFGIDRWLHRRWPHARIW